MATASANTENVSDDQLRVGLYVVIDLPWFQHPFTLNSFRINSLEQVATLRTLGQRRFRYDPERSDAEQPVAGAAADTAKDDVQPTWAGDAFPVDADSRAPAARGEVVGAETLIRWQHPERGLLTPGAFLPLIEGTELIAEIGDWVLDPPGVHAAPAIVAAYP